MYRWATLLLLALVVALVGCGGAARGEQHFRVDVGLATTRFTLPNGLDVILHPDRSFRDVAVSVRYDVGSRDDPSGATGLAHLVEHLTFRGKPDGRFEPLLGGAGSASHNANTSPDATTYYDIVPSEQLPVALFVEAVRMARPLEGVDEASFFVERDVVRNERRERVDDVAYGSLLELAMFLAFDGVSYGRPTVGFPEDLEALTLEDAAQFVRRHYRPNNATLVIAGGFDPKRTRALVEESFGRVPAVEAPRQPTAHKGRHRFPDADHAMRWTVDAGVESPAVVLAWRVPPAGYRGWHEMVLATDVLEATCSREGIRSFSAWVSSGDAASVFIVEAELERTASADDAIGSIELALRRMREGTSLLGPMKSRLITGRTLALEHLGARANALQTFFARYGDANSAHAELHEFSVVSQSDFTDAVAANLRADRRATVIARPKRGAPKAGAWPARLMIGAK